MMTNILFFVLAGTLCLQTSGSGMAGLQPMSGSRDRMSADTLEKMSAAMSETHKMAQSMGRLALPMISPKVNQGQKSPMGNMSMEISRMLDSVKSVADYSRMFGMDMPPPDPMMDDIPEAIKGGCEPELRSVTLDLIPPAGYMYFPNCVKLLRCGGCCGEKRSCMPTREQKFKIRIVKHPIEMMRRQMSDRSSRSRRPATRLRNRSDYRRPQRNAPSRSRRAMMEYDIATVSNHTECKCQCDTVAADCEPSIQIYSERSCECQCKDQLARAECLAKDTTHDWDEKACKCYCKNYLKTYSCGHGVEFSHATCKCKKL